MEKVVCMRCHNVIQIHNGVVSGANNISQNIPHIQTEWGKFRGMLLVPHNIVKNLNNVMMKCWNENIK